MSLLIVGSCSRVTQGVVSALAQNHTYQNIIILDLLPRYPFHQRFYQLQQHLSALNSSTKVILHKLIRIQELNSQIQKHQDLLYVTHDYFQSVTSRDKIDDSYSPTFAPGTTLSSQKKSVFATPVEYDHFGVDNPQAEYLQAQQKAQSSNPNAAFIRSDIQDEAELRAYLHYPRNFLMDRTSIPSSFKPHITCTKKYVKAVVDALEGRPTGEQQLIGGEEKDPMLVIYNKEISTKEVSHFSQNASSLMFKYRSLTSLATQTV